MVLEFLIPLFHEVRNGNTAVDWTGIVGFSADRLIERRPMAWALSGRSLSSLSKEEGVDWVVAPPAWGCQPHNQVHRPRRPSFAF